MTRTSNVKSVAFYLMLAACTSFEEYKDRTLRIRAGKPVSVPVADGVYVLMDVKEISKEGIKLFFPELERDLFLID